MQWHLHLSRWDRQERIRFEHKQSTHHGSAFWWTHSKNMWCRQDSALMYKTAPLELHWWAQATHIFAVIISRLCMHRPLGVLKIWEVTASLLRSHRAYTVFKFVFHFSAFTQWPQRAAVAIIALFLRILCVQFSSRRRTILWVYVTTPFLRAKGKKIST